MKKLLLTLLYLPMLGFGQTTTIWSDDCSSTSTWVLTNSSTLNIDWAIEMDPNATPAGGSLTPMASASAANGYMMVNSDADGGPDGDGTTISCEFTNATPIDLTMYPNVQLTFQHNFRWWQDTRVVRISPDNGTTWVEIDEITNAQGYTYPNQSSNNPHLSTYDISSVAGGMSEVLVQFYYNDNDIWAWYWAVDDIAISELPDNLVVSSEEVMGGWWIGYQTVGGLGQDYTFNPLSQATANPYSFEAVLRNDGIGTQDVTMNVEVTEDASGTNVLSTTANILTLAAGEQDTVAANATFTPANTGLYTVDIWSVSDSAGQGTTITYTDTAVKRTMVTDYIYGKDYGQADGYWRLNSASGFGFEISSTFDMYANANLYSVDAHISDWSIVGSEVFVSLYEEDPSWSGDPILLDQSDPYTITQADIGNWINIDFLSSQSLITGTGYRISIGADMHPTDTVGINLSGNGEYSSQGLYDKDGYYGSLGGPTWYTISDIPMLRMNFDPASVGLSTNYGCTDPLATNYDPIATADDGSCTYPFYGCSPNTFYTAPGMYPDSATGLSPAYVGQSYDEVITSITPLDSTVLINGIALNVTYQYIELTSVIGLPAGFSYGCDPPTCSFPVNSVGCINIVSSGPTINQVGLYPLTLMTTTTFDAGIGIPITQDDVIDDYFIEVLASTPIYGCTDSTATNYDPLATIDDVSCIYCNISNTFMSNAPSTSSSCDGFILSSASSSFPITNYNWIDSQASFMGSSNFISNLCNGAYILTLTDSAGCTFVDTFILGTVFGCTDSLATNYNSFASVDDGSCTYPTVYGCMDSLSYNYDSNANTDNGSCLYCDLSFSLYISQNSSPSACDGFAVLSSVQSSNLPATYLWSTGSTQNNIISLCTGNYTLTVTDAVGCIIDTTVIIGSPAVYGCTDPSAGNYDPSATVDDGSCTYPSVCNEDSPTGLFVDGIIHSRAVINWDNMNSAACTVDQYRIRFREVGTSSWTNKTMGGPIGSCTWGNQRIDKLLLNLTGNTTYEYEMKAWYCGGGASSWTGLSTFTTADNCPNVGNLTAVGANPTKATFTWDASNGVYEFVRLKARVDSISNASGSDWFQIGGAGVAYGTFTKNKNGLVAGETYRGQARAFCDPNGGAYFSLSWSPLVYWTQPVVRVEGGTAIANLDIFPNPSRDVFNITFTSEYVQDLKIRILNVIGEELINDDLQQFIGEYTKQINLHENAKGIYFLEIETNDGVVNKKLILQ